MMKDMSVLQLLPFILFFLTISFAESATGRAAIRADLTHVDSGRGFTKRELLRPMAARTRARVASRWSPPPPGRGGNAHAVTLPESRGTTGKYDRDSEYLIHLGIGTPHPQHVALTMDTGSDLIWTQCGCRVCFDQPFPLLDTSASATVRGLSCFDPLCRRGGLALPGCAVQDNVCSYVYSYGDQSVTAGRILEDTFTFQAPNGKRGTGTVAAVPNLRFGCGMYNTGVFKSNESGIAGFARGPLSLPSQLKVGRFSHCFTTIAESKTSPVFLGTPDNLAAQATGRIQSTPFAPTAQGNTLYYLFLKGITVGGTRLPFDASKFAIKGNGTGGTIIDSGTGMTTFPEAVFQSLRKAFVAQVSLPTEDLDGILCFATRPKQKAPAVPKLILHLEGADWDIPRESYVLDIDDEDGTGGGLCLVLGSGGKGHDLTIIGNFQQQNMHIVYDLEANKLVFVPARCDML
uniref:Uncharacterized protein n=1 Tax=Avena sativa TaxID=4498 RepID=A0ACD5UU71_AVESA